MSQNRNPGYERSALKGGVEAIYRHVLETAGTPSVGAATRPARSAAVILWRPSKRAHEDTTRSTGSPLEIFLGHRSDELEFMAGNWAFPGGAVEDADEAAPVVGADGELAARIAAAARELCEETGIDLPLDAARFDRIADWVTPPLFPRRFDAWYFLARVPDGAEPDYRCSGGELQDGRWWTPSDALAAWSSGRALIPAPVRRTIEALATGLDGARARCDEHKRAAMAGPRLWKLAAGIELCPVRTPTLPPATHTNCYLIGSDEIVVVDPASPYDDERAALDDVVDSLASEGRRVVEIWLTHHHYDHVAGAAYLAERLGVPVAAHAETASRVAGRVEVTRILEDGDTIDLAGTSPRRLRAVFTPGHAPGHMCFYEEHTGFLVAGDMVAGVGTIVVEPSEGDMARYIESLRVMKRLDPRVVLPAHGPAISGPQARLDFYIEHRLWREQRVVDALVARSPATSEQLVELAYDDVPAKIHPLAERSLIAHLVKLQGEGRAVRDGEQWRTAE